MRLDLLANQPAPARAAAALGLIGAGFLIVGWASEHRYASLLFGIAPLVALAGLVITATALRGSRNTRSTALALAGGGLSLVVLLVYAYALLSYGGGGN